MPPEMSTTILPCVPRGRPPCALHHLGEDVGPIPSGLDKYLQLRLTQIYGRTGACRTASPTTRPISSLVIETPDRLGRMAKVCWLGLQGNLYCRLAISSRSEAHRLGRAAGDNAKNPGDNLAGPGIRGLDEDPALAPDPYLHAGSVR